MTCSFGFCGELGSTQETGCIREEVMTAGSELDTFSSGVRSSGQIRPETKPGGVEMGVISLGSYW